MKGVSVVAVLWLFATFCTVAVHSDGCYQHYDHAAQYHLDHEAPSYPWDEVEKAMGQNPMLSQVLAAGTKVPTGRPPGQYYDPVSVVCPSQRFMLKAFQVDNKQCYIIKPEVQQARYVNCNNDQDRNCHYCSLARGAGVSKCEEDYEWLDVWAYCKPVHTPVYYPKVVIHPDPPSLPNPHPGYPQPAIIQPDPQPYPQPQPHPQPYPQPQPHPQPYNPPVQPVHPEPYHPQPQPEYKPYPQPVVKPYPEPRVEEKPTPYIPVGYPKQPPQYPERPQPVYHTDKIYAGRTYRKPWKRSVPVYEGTVEKIALYLPYQCSCKNYKC